MHTGPLPELFTLCLILLGFALWERMERTWQRGLFAILSAASAVHDYAGWTFPIEEAEAFRAEVAARCLVHGVAGDRAADAALRATRAPWRCARS